ncbi:MAG TPA: SMP-30/gluconolactonase/LRE family protein [Alphaproteobacteria bacterium]|nr:SMP-30/gluconolactonase/LRE family protein [Alphaproteobacteria bacterium]
MPFREPAIVPAQVFTRMPDEFRRKRRNAWTDANRGGRDIDSFLEGPSFDRDGNLWVVDVPFGRVFRIAPSGKWTLVAEYDGWPNGLKIHRDGRVFLADYKNGLMIVDPATGRIAPVLEAQWSESFKGLNDLIFAANGDLYFTDQGQTGWHDPSGRVYRLSSAGRLDRLMATIPSPNGIALNLAETQIYVAVTRDNSVWRLPLMLDGSVSKAGAWIRLSGGHAGPDGMALDGEGGLIVCQLGIGVWRFDALGRPTHLVELGAEAYGTNVAFGGPERRTLFITESEQGVILMAEMPAPGRRLFSHD